jgi:photosystem I P700 chlorophyll a apoprotein A2
LWLGFHTLYVYSHNDTVTAFGVPDCQIILEPVFAQLVQSASGSSAYGFSLSSYAANYSQAFLTLSSADFLVHHAISLGLHTTSLILLKGSLDARSSRLVPDKAALGFGFPCDGPGRGGTCDVSSWDTFYLACFWLLNLISWTLFYFHFRHLTLWQQLSSALSENGSSLMSWFRDYLWFNSAPLIRGYSLSAVSDISPWSWIFLAAHLCWAVGFMFLISWRGYWQELIDVIALMHSMSPIVGDIWDSAVFTPSALSIVQARLVGLVHFAAGLIFTYGSFVVGATS